MTTGIGVSTVYGDWGCTVFDTDSEEELGNFCADAGLVSVFLLSEVLAYNPKFDYHKERPWTTALIKDFKGVVQIRVDKISGVYEMIQNTGRKAIHTKIMRLMSLATA